MNRETPFFQGPEKIAASTNQPVFFQHTKKTGRGKYEIEYSVLFENPKEVEQKEILLAYVRKAEEIIRNEPEYYLWSHRRWKHKRPEGIELTV
jgi:KDO2-lipid IV(A) lauroyltransferase